MLASRVPKYEANLSPKAKDETLDMFKINLVNIDCQSIRSELPNNVISSPQSPHNPSNLLKAGQKIKKKSSFYTSKWSNNLISVDSSIDQNRSSRSNHTKNSLNNAVNLKTGSIQSEDLSPRDAFSPIGAVDGKADINLDMFS
jgi:hypothetical protein